MTVKEMPAELVALRDKMLKTSFFAMFRTLKDAAKMKSVWVEHVKWLIDLEKRDLVFASGPLLKRDGSQDPGLTIFRVATFADAERLATEDPFVMHGGVDYQVRCWPFGIGRINLAVDFSDQTYRFR
jgi:uncharacterized protein YciI